MRALLSSREVFAQFVISHEDGKPDVSGILSRECYEFWLETRVCWPKRPEEAFRKAVVALCQGAGGRNPLPQEVEIELLKLLRKKTIWPCFKFSKCKVGSRGFKSLGYWEKQHLECQLKDKRRASCRSVNPRSPNPIHLSKHSSLVLPNDYGPKHASLRDPVAVGQHNSEREAALSDCMFGEDDWMPWC